MQKNITKQQRYHELGNLLLGLMEKMGAVREKVRYFDTPEKLHKSEIHLIKMIAENEGCYGTILARHLGVTKGAVSQLILRLEKKKMLEKTADPKNLSRSILHLTKRGKKAYESHERLHRQYELLIIKSLRQAGEEHAAFLESFLQKLGAGLAAFCEAEEKDLKREEKETDAGHKSK